MASEKRSREQTGARVRRARKQRNAAQPPAPASTGQPPPSCQSAPLQVATVCGLPSGHAAVAFAGWVAVTYVTGDEHRFLVSSIALLLALLVAQSRVESGVHSLPEVALGAIFGSLAALVVFQLA